MLQLWNRAYATPTGSLDMYTIATVTEWEVTMMRSLGASSCYAMGVFGEDVGPGRAGEVGGPRKTTTHPYKREWSISVVLSVV